MRAQPLSEEFGVLAVPVAGYRECGRVVKVVFDAFPRWAGFRWA